MKKYFKNCKRLFPVYGSSERQYLARLRNHVLEYQADHESCTYEDIVAEFGSPTEIVGSYYRSMDDNYLLKKANFVTHFRILIAVIVGIIILFLGYKSFTLYQTYLETRDTSTLYEETIIEEYENMP